MVIQKHEARVQAAKHQDTGFVDIELGASNVRDFKKLQRGSQALDVGCVPNPLDASPAEIEAAIDWARRKARRELRAAGRGSKTTRYADTDHASAMLALGLVLDLAVMVGVRA